MVIFNFCFNLMHIYRKFCNKEPGINLLKRRVARVQGPLGYLELFPKNKVNLSFI